MREPSYTPDMAAEVDQPHEILAEQLGMSVALARRVMEWHEAEVEREVGCAKARQLARLCGFLLGSAGPVAVRVYAVAFAAGLDQLNGLHSQAEAARKLGCTRSNLNHFVTAAADLLGLKDAKFRNNPEARASTKAAAHRYWAKWK